jgi:hypothetical protein
MTDKIDIKILSQKWVHSHEEDTPGETVFRPASYAFPRSRGRKSFQLDPHGKLLTFGMGADDRIVEGEGRWQLDAANNLTLQPKATGSVQSVMHILQVEPDKLIVKKQ